MLAATTILALERDSIFQRLMIYYLPKIVGIQIKKLIGTELKKYGVSIGTDQNLFY
jgi:hypothetical protein